MDGCHSPCAKFSWGGRESWPELVWERKSDLREAERTRWTLGGAEMNEESSGRPREGDGFRREE